MKREVRGVDRILYNLWEWLGWKLCYRLEDKDLYQEATQLHGSLEDCAWLSWSVGDDDQ